MYSNFYLIYYNILLIAVIVESFSLQSIANSYIPIKKKVSNIWTFLVIVALAIILGYRPGSTLFGDTIFYQSSYENKIFAYDTEPVFNAIGRICSNLGFSVGIYLSIIAFFYILLPYLFLDKHLNSKWFSLLMIMASFSFLGYGVNGARNGLALSLIAYSFSFISVKGKVNWVMLLVCFFLALGIHKSSMLPICCMMLSLFVVKEVKTAILIWLLCIPISFFGGSSLSPLFLGLGFDDRLDEYLLTTTFRTGFRWDFILYSMIPILLAYYIVYIKKVLVDRLYVVLINTYTLSNALWIIIINASFSNRFAYLSWFMYPIVFAYPLLKYKIWGNQRAKVGAFLFFYYLFTYVMLVNAY